MAIPVRLPDLDHWKAQVKCQAGCPVATDAGRYVQLIAEGRDEEAYLVARAPNPFASICGRVCAAPCEDACRRGTIDAPISIRALKRFVAEQYGVESTQPDTQDRLITELVSEGNRYAGHLPVSSRAGQAASPSRRRVAVVGSGPAGMSAAHDLALLGYQVTVFEAADEPGGMVRYGIPEYRLPRTLLRAEIDKVVRLGVTLELGKPLTEEFGLAELRKEGFEAVFLSVGVAKGRDLQLPGVELDGVVKAVDYLLHINRGFRMDLGRRVVVIGGGFVAFDAARTALRLADDAHAFAALASEADARVKEAFDSARSAIRAGATEVTVVSLENFEEMPVLRTTQGHEEFEESKKEGIRFLPRRGPRRFLGSGRSRRHRAARRGVGLRCRGPLRSRLSRRRPGHHRSGRLHPGDRPACGPVVPQTRRRHCPDADGHHCRRLATRSRPRRPASSPEATSPSVRGISSTRSPTGNGPRSRFTNSSPATTRRWPRASTSRRSPPGTTG